MYKRKIIFCNSHFPNEFLSQRFIFQRPPDANERTAKMPAALPPSTDPTVDWPTAAKNSLRKARNALDLMHANSLANLGDVQRMANAGNKEAADYLVATYKAKEVSLPGREYKMLADEDGFAQAVHFETMDEVNENVLKDMNVTMGEYITYKNAAHLRSLLAEIHNNPEFSKISRYRPLEWGMYLAGEKYSDEQKQLLCKILLYTEILYVLNEQAEIGPKFEDSFSLLSGLSTKEVNHLARETANFLENVEYEFGPDENAAKPVSPDVKAGMDRLEMNIRTRLADLKLAYKIN